jgi:hypothetical protein
MLGVSEARKSRRIPRKCARSALLPRQSPIPSKDLFVCALDFTNIASVPTAPVSSAPPPLLAPRPLLAPSSAHPPVPRGSPIAHPLAAHRPDRCHRDRSRGPEVTVPAGSGCSRPAPTEAPLRERGNGPHTRKSPPAAECEDTCRWPDSLRSHSAAQIGERMTSSPRMRNTSKGGTSWEP